MLNEISWLSSIPHQNDFTRHLLVLLDLADASFLIAKPLCWVVPESAMSHGQLRNQKTSSSVLCDWLKSHTYRHSFLISAMAFLVMLRGNSMASMPFRIMLYVFMGSDPVNGGVPVNKQIYLRPSLYNRQHKLDLAKCLPVFPRSCNGCCILTITTIVILSNI